MTKKGGSPRRAGFTVLPDRFVGQGYLLRPSNCRPFGSCGRLSSILLGRWDQCQAGRTFRMRDVELDRPGPLGDGPLLGVAPAGQCLADGCDDALGTPTAEVGAGQAGEGGRDDDARCWITLDGQCA